MLLYSIALEKKKVKQIKIESETCLKLEGMAENGVL